MKLATYKDGSRDGQLLVVSRDLSQAHYAHGIAGRLQQLLDDWNFLSPQLEELYTALNQGRARHALVFDPQRCLAPLPRAYQWLEGEGGTALRQGASDDFLGPQQPARFGAEALGLAFEPGLAAILGDVGQGASAEQGLDSVRLLALVSGWRLRQLQPSDPLTARPATAFGPVVLTPDELGEACWPRGKQPGQLLLQTRWNGRKHGAVELSGAELSGRLGALIQRAARTRNLRAGTLVGSGPLAALEADAVMQFGDSLHIEIKPGPGLPPGPLFGAIDQDVLSLHQGEPAERSAAA